MTAGLGRPAWSSWHSRCSDRVRSVRRRACLRTLTALIALSGCAAIRRNEAKFAGDHLVAAGFAVTRPDREYVHSLPALKMVERAKNGGPEYVYRDPYRCHCVYVGDRHAYEEYRRLVSDDFLDALLSTPNL